MAPVCSVLVTPLLVLVGVVMVADAGFVGNRLERFIKPVATTLKNSAGMVYWTLMTVLRDTLVSWAMAIVLLLVVG